MAVYLWLGYCIRGEVDGWGGWAAKKKDEDDEEQKSHCQHKAETRRVTTTFFWRLTSGMLLRAKSSCVCRSCRTCSRRSEIAQLLHVSHGRLGLSSVAASSQHLNSAYTEIAAS